MIVIYLIITGLCIASFIGTASYRLPRQISLLTPPSFCPHCKKRLAPYDLIPVVSYLILRGKCRYCGTSIPVQYFITELVIPASYAGLYYTIGLNPLFFIYAYLTTVLIYLALRDIDTGYIALYDIVLVWISGAVLAFLAIRGYASSPFLEYLWGLVTGVVLVFVSYGVIFIIKRRIPMGAGDLMVIPGIAIHFNFQGVIRVLLFSSILGVVVGFLLMLTGIVKREHKFPMFPYLAAGVLIELFLFSRF